MAFCKVESPRPTSKEAQPPISELMRSRVREKIEKVIHRCYMVCDDTHLKSYIRYFGVPKGDDDIRLVYDGTTSGLNLNDSLWVPSFWLPIIDSVTRALGADSYMADRDVGDCFLNYQLLDPAVVPFTQVLILTRCTRRERMSRLEWVIGIEVVWVSSLPPTPRVYSDE